jgi:hypothetical protein
MLGYMPPFYAGDAEVRAALDGLALEIDRAWAFLEGVRAQLFPQSSDDGHGMLGLFEALVGLPVAPPGVSLADRRSKVMAYMQARNVSSGLEWSALLTAAIGTTSWSYQEGPGAAQVLLQIPHTGAYSTAAVEGLARRVTPAHLTVTATTTAGFVIGSSVSDPDASAIGTDVI